jgi:hypothetical protein
MTFFRKPFAAMMAAAAVLFLGFAGSSAQAQSVITNGSSFLSDVLGSGPTSPETLTINWSVTFSAGIYTYSYTINNPSGDVVLNPMGGPTMTPEIVDAFSVGFDTTAPGAYVSGSISGGAFDQNNGPDGLSWAFTGVNPGTSSPTLSFESDLPPAMGTANASDRNPPSPWSSVPNGQLVPIPAPVPEPSTWALLVLGSFAFAPFRSTLLRFVRKS